MSLKTHKKTTLTERHDRATIMPIDSSDIRMGGLEGYIGYNLRRAHIGEFQRFTHHFAEHDIRPQQFSVLLLIHENPGINQSQLGNSLGIKRANVVTMLHELEARDLVERCPSSQDKRSYTLRMTDIGLAIMADLQRVHDELEAGASACLGKENRNEFLRLLKLLRANNQHIDGD